ncbi:FHA domain-containing protein [Microbacterium sp. CIAB417]|uniref:FHA domain-containing protein n=1 Tax=Microbacterium sp. CIAB417 TaxID=2860287 RepID=UPI001FADDD63|nr:FHA domain-containing protein [Microbacterium sp. CIAB417]
MSTQPHTPTTTHDAWGAGDPHLRITRGDDRLMFHLRDDVVRIGSAAGNELVLPGAEAVHATITHDERDEYVLTLHGPGETNAASQDASGERTEILRTGARFTVGEWELVFGREESADHGRPYGGRQGGELSDQDLQPPRPDYRADAAATRKEHAADSAQDGPEAAPAEAEDPTTSNASGQGGSADGSERSSTTRRLAGDKQGATAPDEDGASDEPWS